MARFLHIMMSGSMIVWFKTVMIFGLHARSMRRHLPPSSLFCKPCHGLNPIRWSELKINKQYLDFSIILEDVSLLNADDTQVHNRIVIDYSVLLVRNLECGWPLHSPDSPELVRGEHVAVANSKLFMNELGSKESMVPWHSDPNIKQTFVNKNLVMPKRLET